ncbi:MAG: C-terminal binding protein [Anaerolineae bacterium]|nr:C-terminal binding protein [Anaerolineae bacterium]
MFKVVHAEADSNAELPIERAILAEAGATLVCAGTTDADALIAVAHDADAVLSEFMPFDRRTLEGLARCKAVVGYTIGLDHYDLDAATELGIAIAHTPGFCTEEVANHAMALILACARRLLTLDRKVRAGWWPDPRHLERDLTPLGSLYGQTLGLLGFGGIARSVARKARAFDMIVQAFDPYVSEATFTEHGVRPCDLDELVAGSDYLSIHAPLTPATRHVIGEAQLRRMKPGAFLINTSRGAVVDEAALVRALREGWIAGAALDVFEQEPPAPDHPLLQLDNVIVTPHAAYCSDGSYARVRRMAAEEAARALRGEWPVALANPAVKANARLIPATTAQKG